MIFTNISYKECQVAMEGFASLVLFLNKAKDLLFSLDKEKL
jgi:hypothetical protein